MNKTQTGLCLVSLVLTLAAVSPARAQSTWFLYNSSTDGCTQNGQNTGSFNNSWSCKSNNSTNLTASAWSANPDRGVSGGISGTGLNGTSTSTKYGAGYYLSGSGFASAYMSSQGNSGFGATSRYEAQVARANGDTTPLDPTSPDHSFDSVAPGSFDMMLLDFGSTAVILDKIGIGWTGGDSDITVMRWTGTTAPPTTLGSSSLSNDGEQNLSATLYNPATPSTAGWQLVGSYADLGTDNTNPFGGQARATGATMAQASSWWLISAFNTTMTGGSTSCLKADGTTTTCIGTAGPNDSFKLNYIQTTAYVAPPPQSQTPEPASLALAAVGLAGAMRARRKAKRHS